MAKPDSGTVIRNYLAVEAEDFDFSEEAYDRIERLMQQAEDNIDSESLSMFSPAFPKCWKTLASNTAKMLWLGRIWLTAK